MQLPAPEMPGPRLFQMAWHMAPLLPDIDRQAVRTSEFTSTWVSTVEVQGGFCAVHLVVRSRQPAPACAATNRKAITGPSFRRVFMEPPSCVAWPREAL